MAHEPSSTPSDQFRESRWTFYPSLLASLPSDELRVALEDAACAQVCGRYQQGRAIFDSEWTEPSASPIVALQLADMLTHFGYEHERIKLLQEALAVGITVERSIRLLMEFMLADAQVWALGLMKPAIGLLSKVRHQLSSSGISNLSDIEFRLFTLYYGVVSTFEGLTNNVGQSDRTVFSTFDGDKSKELHHLRKTLHSQARWRFASTAMQLELSHTTPGPALRDTVSDAIELCDVLDRQPEAAIKFRSVVLKKQLASILAKILPPMATELERQYITTIGMMKGGSYGSWEEFCPAYSLDIAKAKILESQGPPGKKLDQLLSLATDAEQRGDYTKANQVTISARDVAREWLANTKGTDTASIALQRLRAVNLAYLSLHRDTTRLGFYEAVAYSDYQTTLLVRDHNYRALLSSVEAFQELHPMYEVPRHQERQFDHGIRAAMQLGLLDKQSHFSTQYRKWLAECNFIKGFTLTADGIAHSEAVGREIMISGEDTIQWGVNALRTMLRWAGEEWELRLLSSTECALLFKLSSDSYSPNELGKYLKEEVDVQSVAQEIFGSIEPTESFEFLTHCQKLRDWILTPDRPPSLAARILALRVLMQSRLYRVREFLAGKGALPSNAQVVALQEEYQALSEIEQLERRENAELENVQETDVWAAIHATLLKSSSWEARQSGLITDEELSARATECEELITRLHDSGDRIGEYRAICQMATLLWQRYSHFRTIKPEAVLRVAENGERVFIETRKSVIGLGPSEDLVAKAQLSQNFAHREHYNFALAASLAVFDDSLTEATKASNYLEFLRWTLRSKGRGFTDTLNRAFLVPSTGDSSFREDPLESGGSESGTNLRSTLGVANITSELEAVILNPPEGSADGSIQDEIHEMLQGFPKEVVLVDFIEIRYSKDDSTTFVAIIYRKGQPSQLVKVPGINLKLINGWVQHNLEDIGKGSVARLGDGNAIHRLAELSGLLEPMTREGANGAIQPNETVIFCPTGSLHRIPIHAIPVAGRAFIERNPVVYCQSLTVLQRLWQRNCNMPHLRGNAKRIVINPMPETWDDKNKTPVASTPAVTALGRELDATLHQGTSLSRSNVMAAMSNASVVHYHGHVIFNPRSALDSTLLLDGRAASKPSLRRHLEPSAVIPARELFSTSLKPAALVTLIGCGSGMTTVSNTDDVLGWPTALFAAGATAVVSTLWPIDDLDGAAFATAFYRAISAARRKRVSGNGAETGNAEERNVESPEGSASSRFLVVVDVAKAMQTAVCELRSDATHENHQAPYHWASFVLNGLPVVPDDNFSTLENIEKS